MPYAVITGATKGIGRAIAQLLLHEGYCVIGNYGKDEDAAQAFLDNNRQYADKITLLRKELSSYEAAQELAETVKAITPTLHCLVLNSGTTDVTPFGSITKESWERVMNVNLNAPFFLIQALSEALAENDGRVLLIGSLCGQYPHARSISYGVSKAAVHDMARELVKFFAPRHITVNAIVPGFTDTPWQQTKAPDHRKRIEDKIALHRFAQPEEIAELCLNVIHNQYINGAVLHIDGGYCYQ